MKALSIALLSALVCLWTVLPLAAQDAPTDLTCNEDLTGETIPFYHFGDLSGLFAELTVPVLLGFEDATAYFNAQGGICGAEIVAEYRDTAGAQEAAQAAWDEFTNRDDANIIFVYVPDDAELLREQAAQQQIPIFVSSGSVLSLYGEDAATPGWVFSVTPLYADQMGLFCDYLSEHWADFGIEGDPVIGHISFPGALGEASNTPETQAYCESKGVGYAGDAFFLPTLPDISSLVNGLIEKGANVLYTTSLANGPALVATALTRLEMRDQVLVAGPNIVLDASTINAGGADVQGIIGQLPYLWWDEADQPGIQTITQYWAENRLPQYESDTEAALATRNVAYLVAWAAIDMYRRVLTETINRVGFENLDGAALYETITSGQTFSALEGVITIQFDENARAPRESRLGEIQFNETAEGVVTPQILPLTDFIPVPDLRPGGADVVE